MSKQHFLIHKTQSNNFSLDYPNKLTNQIDLYFQKLYFSPLIRMKIECIDKQLLVDVNYSNKAIWKSTLNKASKYAFVIRVIILKSMGRCLN